MRDVEQVRAITVRMLDKHAEAIGASGSDAAWAEVTMALSSLPEIESLVVLDDRPCIVALAADEMIFTLCVRENGSVSVSAKRLRPSDVAVERETRAAGQTETGNVIRRTTWSFSYPDPPGEDKWLALSGKMIARRSDGALTLDETRKLRASTRRCGRLDVAGRFDDLRAGGPAAFTSTSHSDREPREGLGCAQALPEEPRSRRPLAT